MIQTSLAKLRTFIATKQCFYFILGLFVAESAWIALSGRYPMAFDEDFHLGIIRIYAHHLSPFFAHQPANADAFGAVARDPSYLYHYLMSFPYRLISFLTDRQSIQVLFLRFIDIGLFAWSLGLFRRLLIKTRAGVGWVHLALLFFILIPVVPELAAQINYDDLFMPLTALALLLSVDIVARLRGGQLPLRRLLWLGSLCLLTSLVKYAFLPIFAVIVAYLVIELVVWYRRVKSPLQKWQQALKATSIWLITASLAILILSGGLFFERYGINTIKYHTPIPACDAVLSIPECSAYGPWDRDYIDRQTKGYVNPNKFHFTDDWLYGLFERSFFAVNGPESSFATQPAFPIIGVTAASIGILGFILLIRYSWRILRRTSFMGFLLAVVIIYGAALWFQNYSDFLRVGQPVAINGRYVFPVLLPLLLAIGQAYRELFGRLRTFRDIAIIVVLLTFGMQGGGALTFILRSDPSWYWPNNRLIDNMNHWVQDIFNSEIKH